MRCSSFENFVKQYTNWIKLKSCKVLQFIVEYSQKRILQKSVLTKNKKFIAATFNVFVFLKFRKTYWIRPVKKLYEMNKTKKFESRRKQRLILSKRICQKTYLQTTKKLTTVKFSKGNLSMCSFFLKFLYIKFEPTGSNDTFHKLN